MSRRQVPMSFHVSGTAQVQPESAMVFAAGFGTRMGSLTKRTPKPMIRVGGRPLIDHALEQVRNGGIRRIVVNTHYLFEQIESHLATMNDVTVVRETPDILDTGGGLRNALPHLCSNPVCTLNSDYVWSGHSPFKTLSEAWDPERMDGLILMLTHDQALGYVGPGDFCLGNDGRLAKPMAGGRKALVYAGAQIIKTDSLAEIPERSFSVSLLWQKMIRSGRLFGIRHTGGWVDVGHPAGIACAESFLENQTHV